MLLQRSVLAVRRPERPRLAPFWTIALLGAMVGIVLVAIFPHGDLLKRIKQAPPSDLTEAYLRNLLRTEPDSPQLGVLLAQMQLRAGLPERVRASLRTALNAPDAALRRDALWLLLQAEETHYLQLPATHPHRAEIRERLIGYLRDLIDAGDYWSIEERALFAGKALSLGAGEFGLALLADLAWRDPQKADHWYALGARAALAQTNYRAAAELLLQASRNAISFHDQRNYFLEAMQVLRSGDLIPDALRLAEGVLAEQPRLASDLEVLTLLVTYARAAQRPDLAARYARLLLRLSLLEQLRRVELAAAYGVGARFARVSLRGGPQLPFDDRVYSLGYQVFLENRDLEDAWKVALSAVQHDPDSATWRERLAQVSEWTGRPALALEHWLHLAQHNNLDAAWQAVLRLAPGLLDDHALRPALLRELARRPGDERLIRELTALYERIGDPQAARAFLERQHAALGRPAWLLLEMAELAERAGEPRRALGLWRQYVGIHPPSPAQAIRIATLMLVQGEAEAALALLEATRAGAGAEDVAFWRLTAELGRLLQRDDLATDAFRRIVTLDVAEERDYAALFALLEAAHPREAAQLAELAWRRFASADFLLQALGAYARGAHWAEFGRLLGTLPTETVARLRKQPQFLRLTALHHQNAGRLQAARRDMEMALRLSPHDSDLMQGLLWLAIDSNDPQALRRMLGDIEARGRHLPETQDALAAAYQSLSLPAVALNRHLSPRLAEKQNDFLWLMNYADALDQNQETDRAWRLRRHLLREQQALAPPDGWLTRDGSGAELDAVRRIARARLAISLGGGDSGRAVMRELLQLDRDAAVGLSPAARQLVAGWLQDQGEHHAERGWLWQQFAATVARPLWADITVALVEDDRARLGDLLDRHGERLPRYDRINAARRLDDVRLAQTDAFETQTQQPDDDPLHLQLTEVLLAHSHSLGAAVTGRDVGTLDERETRAHWHVALSPRLKLDLTLGTTTRMNRDATAIGLTPDSSVQSAQLSWRHRDGETRFGLAQRQGFADLGSQWIEHRQRLDQRLDLTVGAGRQLPATETLALRVAGMRDGLFARLDYRLTLRDRFSIGQYHDRYAAQTGSPVGEGRHLRLEYAHAFRLEPRDLEASLFWSSHRFERQAVGDPRLLPLLPAGVARLADLGGNFFVPDDYTFYGLRLSTNVRFAEEYTRAWRPYATLARTWHSQLGAGYDIGAGLAGSVFGADHLRFGFSLGRSGTTGGGLVRETGFSYRFHF